MSAVLDNPALFVGTTAENESRNTPVDIWRRVVEIDEIGLDPCSNPMSNVPARVRLYKEDDGLSHTWRHQGLVFVNPPYGREILRWVQKGVDEQVEIIYLLPARTETHWFQYHFAHFQRCLFWGRRLRFEDAETGKPVLVFDKKTGTYKESGAPFPSVLFYAGDRADKFEWAFRGCGLTVIPQKAHWLLQ